MIDIYVSVHNTRLQKENIMKRERIVYFDYLRVAATIAVVILHAAAQNWGEFGGRSLEWNILNFYDSIVRWGVAVFIMISGALFLEKETDTKKLYLKSILRLAVAYCVWSVIYAVTPLVVNDSGISYRSIIANIITGSYHMWFIPMIIGMYMCVPILKEIVRKDTISKYFLLLSLVFGFIIPQIVTMSNDFIGGLFADGINKINGVISDMGMHLVLGYSFYFVLGYWLNKVELTQKQRFAIYVLGIVGFISTILLNAVVTWKTNVLCNTYYGNLTINVFLESIAVHTWIKYKKYDNDKLNYVISILSKYSFGAYLVHVFVLKVLKVLGIHTMLFHPIVSVPIISVIVIILSFVISGVINKIPFLNKWVV